MRLYTDGSALDTDTPRASAGWGFHSMHTSPECRLHDTNDLIVCTTSDLYCFVVPSPHPPTPVKSLPWYLISNGSSSNCPRPSPFSAARKLLTPSTLSSAPCSLRLEPDSQLWYPAHRRTTRYHEDFRKLKAHRTEKSLDSRWNKYADHLANRGVPGSGDTSDSMLSWKTM